MDNLLKIGGPSRGRWVTRALTQLVVAPHGLHCDPHDSLRAPTVDYGFVWKRPNTCAGILTVLKPFVIQASWSW
jgi:hypothetical protein